MPSLEKLFEFINVDELVEIASGLIRIPSPSGEESAVMDFARGILAEHSIGVEVLGRDPVRPNVVASVGTGQGPVIVFNGHLDTVPVLDP